MRSHIFGLVFVLALFVLVGFLTAIKAIQEAVAVAVIMTSIGVLPSVLYALAGVKTIAEQDKSDKIDKNNG